MCCVRRVEPCWRVAAKGTFVDALLAAPAELQRLGQQRVQAVDLDEFLGQPIRAVVPVDWVADDAAELGVADVHLGKRLAVLALTP